MKHVAALLLLLAAAVPTPAQHPSGARPSVAARTEGASQAGHVWVSTDAYPLDTCIVRGRVLGENVVRIEARGRVFKLCSIGCQEKLAKDAASFASKLDQAAIALQLPDYPLDRCPISGRPLGTAVKPVDLVLDGHLMRLCGQDCRAEADRRRAQIVAGIEAVASARQRSGYSLSTCVSTGEPLRLETTVEVMRGTTLLRFGSQECLQDRDSSPAEFIREVRAARAEVQPIAAGGRTKGWASLRDARRGPPAMMFLEVGPNPAGYCVHTQPKNSCATQQLAGLGTQGRRFGVPASARDRFPRRAAVRSEAIPAQLESLVRTSPMQTVLLLPFVSVLFLLQAPAQDTPATKPAASAWKTTDAYPLDTCLVSGRPFAGEEMKVVEVEGCKFKLCSAACEEKLRKDPQGYLAKLDSAVVEAQLADYPLDICPISGKNLGSMGEPVKLVLGNHLVQLCCKGCTAKAKAKKDEIVRGIQTAAYTKQKDSYPLKTCLNTGEELDRKGTIEVMHGTTLLRFGGQECLQDLDRSPAALIREVRAARAKVQPKDAGSASPRPPVIGFHGVRQSDPKPFPRNSNPS